MGTIHDRRSAHGNSTLGEGVLSLCVPGLKHLNSNCHVGRQGHLRTVTSNLNKSRVFGADAVPGPHVSIGHELHRNKRFAIVHSTFSQTNGLDMYSCMQVWRVRDCIAVISGHVGLDVGVYLAN
eukprot:4859917-Amphidinium_carterae.1